METLYRKKVVQVVEDLKIGGLEKVVASIATGLDKHKYNVEVWCLAGGGEIANDLMRAGIELKLLDFSSYHNPLNILRLAEKIRASNIDIIHTHAYFAGTFGRLAAIIARVPVIISHVHSTHFNYTKRNILIEKILSLFTDKIICISKAVRKFVVDTEHVHKNKTCLIYNAIEKHARPSREISDQFEKKRLPANTHGFVIIVVASLTSNKGHKVLIDALKILSEKIPDIILRIVGDGPLKYRLMTYVKNIGIPAQVVFMGERKDVLSVLRTSDLCILPSIEREGLGLALIEAMSVGIPVIGSNLGGIPELIENNVNGLLVKPGDHRKLAAAIFSLVKDPAMRERMGKMGKKTYENKFIKDRMIRSVTKVYDDSFSNRNCS